MSEVDRAKLSEVDCNPDVDGRVIDGFSNYCVTPDGFVWSKMWRGGPKIIAAKMWKRLSPIVTVSGYAVVNLMNGKMFTRRIHQLVLETFIGPKPTGDMVVCHNDGNKLNNSLGNLRWGTVKENCADQLIHGTRCRGERHGCSKTNENCVIEIREKYLSGNYTQTRLAKEYGLSQGVISKICLGELWKHV